VAEINLVVGIKAPISKVYGALTTLDGLRKWWASDTSGEAGEVGGIVRFRFGSHGPDMKVTELAPNALVMWKCTHHGPSSQEWVGTKLSFALTERDGQVILRFRHSDWEQASDFLAFCSTKWAMFLLSLRESLERGTGRPYPFDLQIT
jgi:uncharacterized protein YndB with AHSA1/START domain